MEGRTNYCRLCLGEEGVDFDLFNSENESQSYFYQIFEMFGIELTNMDQWPSNGCVNCIRLLDEVAVLKAKIVSTQMQLLKKLPQVKDESDPPEIVECVMEDITDPIAQFHDEMDSKEDIGESIEEEEEDIEIEYEMEEYLSSSEDEVNQNEDIPEDNNSLPSGSVDNPDSIKATKKQTKTQPKPLTPSKKTPKEGPTIENRAALEDLMKASHLLQCSLCQEAHDTFVDLRRHMERDHDLKKGYILCCDRKYEVKTAYQHMQYHLDKEAFKCPACPKTYTCQRDLTKHTSYAHVTEQDVKFNCEVCGQGFSKSYHLKTHAEKHKTVEERLVKCPECPRTFVNKCSVDMHVKLEHTGEREHMCEYCGKGFVSKSLMRAHFRDSHEQKTTKACEICGKHVFNVSQHKRLVHTNTEKIPCKECGKEYTKRRMSTHMNTFHSGRKYKCTVCEKEFVHRATFTNHMNIHLGIKRDCYFCSVQATDSGNLVKHLKQAHPVEYEEYKQKKFVERRVKNTA